ncbi:MAG: hypothetical protein IT269_05235 [Saprospiraceae bacterium]|nr:hypothetical protein [Saprospiraceae bacterium]
MSALLDTPLLRHPKPWWQPFISLAITLYGILVLHWNLQSIVFLFWWEIVLIFGSALIRVLFSMNSQPFFETLRSKIFWLIGGAIMGFILLALAVSFTFTPFEQPVEDGAMREIPRQTNLLSLSYALGLLVHFFLNGRYKTADPGSEIATPFVHIFILLALLMVFTRHLIPAHPEWHQAQWTVAALVVVKFVVDGWFGRSFGVYREG